jgi:hypothetical protein
VGYFCSWGGGLYITLVGAAQPPHTAHQAWYMGRTSFLSFIFFFFHFAVLLFLFVFKNLSIIKSD